jgi:hypothetical protein
MWGYAKIREATTFINIAFETCSRIVALLVHRHLDRRLRLYGPQWHPIRVAELHLSEGRTKMRAV